MVKKLLTDVTAASKTQTKPSKKISAKKLELALPLREQLIESDLVLSEDSKTNIQKLLLIIITALIGIGLAILFVSYLITQNRHKPNQVSAQVKAASITPQENITSHLMFVGDVFWGRAIETAAQRSGNGPANLFRGLTATDKQGYDAWVGDMECPVTDKNIPYKTQIESLIFNCRPEYTLAAAKWFDVMTLANNHTDNNGGADGLSQTRSNLDKAGIQYFGNYNMNINSDICEIVSIKAHDTNDSSNIFQIPVAMCGYDYVGNVVPQVSQMQVMTKYSKVMPVFAMPHMGVEYRSTAEDAKVTTYRQLIDNGADVVIAAHPHVVQNTESYKGHLIAYSVGNFLFDQQILGRDTTETLGVGISISTSDYQAVQTYKGLAASCRAFKDDCLAQLQQKIAHRPTFIVSYDFQCFDESSGTPVKASQTVCNQIKARATVDNLHGLSPTW